MRKGVVNSHVQMPKSVLKRFEKGGKLFYYDVENGFIGNNGHAKSINTESGYYSQEIEDYLRDTVEAPFGNLLKSIDEINLEADSFISSDFDETVKIFAYALLSRSPMMLTSIDKASVFFQFMNKQDRHDYAAQAGIELAKQQNILNKFISTIAINRSSTPLILPICGLYTIRISHADCIVIPVSPETAVVLVPKKSGLNIIRGREILFLMFVEDSAIQRLNRTAFRTQVQYNYGCVVSPSKFALEQSREM